MDYLMPIVIVEEKQWYSSSWSCAASMDFPDSHTIHPYHPSVLAGLLDYILCLYRAVVDMFLVDQHMHVHVKGSIKEHYL